VCPCRNCSNPPAWSEYGQQQQAHALHAPLQPQFQRRSAAPQQPDVPTTPAVQGSVSTEVFSEMNKMQDDIKNLERNKQRAQQAAHAHGGVERGRPGEEVQTVRAASVHTGAVHGSLHVRTDVVLVLAVVAVFVAGRSLWWTRTPRRSSR